MKLITSVLIAPLQFIVVLLSSEPQSVQLRENGSTKQSITVEWDPPAGTVDYYTVSCSHGIPSADRINYTIGIVMASCTGLSQPGNEYTIIVVSYSGGKMSQVASKIITACEYCEIIG